MDGTMIIPVLDLKDKIAVSGKSGERDTYQPLKTIFHKSSEPVKIANKFLDYGFERVYIADLDSIGGTGSNLELVSKINHFLPVMLDCGANDLNSVKEALKYAQEVIVGTETLRNLDDLSLIFQALDSNRIILSVDVKDGEVLSKAVSMIFEDLFNWINEFQPKETILLDISRVGTFKGINQDLILKFNELKTSLIVGGGLQGDELPLIHDLGVNKVLVGSALHNGKLKLGQSDKSFLSKIRRLYG
jgi:phosphoribosylformimino-5-aminoimidazole carboxamide ribotide isomerase